MIYAAFGIKKMTTDLSVSVVIPTYNRSGVLEKALEAYQEQDYPLEAFNIIVVDDGSTDSTRFSVDRFIKNQKLTIFYYHQENRGPAEARNLGIKRSNSEIVLIVNDDTIPSPTLLSEHARSHKLHSEISCAVLGFFTWSPELKVTPFMKWLEDGGPQFSYKKISGSWAHWSQLWTCNISFKRNFLLKYGLFDEDFPHAAWEDVELGYRLSKHGLKIFYDPEAIGYHYHPTDLTTIIERMKKHGAGTVIFGKKVKESLPFPPLSRTRYARWADFIDRLVFTRSMEALARILAFWAERRFTLPLLFDILLLHYRIVGRRQFLERDAIK